jgi:hypothetical protein
MSLLAPESTYLDDEYISAIGSAIARYVHAGESFIHRRVESVNVPAPEHPTYRRRLSIDFSIPDVPALAVPEPIVPAAEPAPAAPASAPASEYLLPLALISRWPPLFSLDLRSPSGDPIPFLTWEQNQRLDAAVLIGLARLACGVEPDQLHEDIVPAIRDVVGARQESVAYRHLFGRLLPLLEEVPDEHLHEHLAKLRRSQPFTALASSLCSNSLLWFSVMGTVGSRMIVKYAFEDPWEHVEQQTLRQSLGLVPFIVKFPCPFIGDSESYHLSVTGCEPLRLVDARLVIRAAPTPTSTEERILSDRSTYGVEQTAPHLTTYANQSATKAKFYAVGRRFGCAAEASVAVEVETRGFLHGAIGASLAVTTLVALFAFNLTETARQTEAGVAVLLLAPGLLAYVLVRPSEHVLVGGFVRGLRRVLIGAGILPVVAAVLLTMADGDPSGAVVALFKLDALGLSLTTVLFAAARFLPKGDWARPLSSGKWERVSTRQRQRRLRKRALSAKAGDPGRLRRAGRGGTP